MKTAAKNYDDSIAKELELIVCKIFDCRLHEIYGFSDTVPKKVVVFILSKLYSFDKRQIGCAYQITYLFVPTVVEKMELQMLRNQAFRLKIIAVCREMGFKGNITERDFNPTQSEYHKETAA